MTSKFVQELNWANLESFVKISAPLTSYQIKAVAVVLTREGVDVKIMRKGIK